MPLYWEIRDMLVNLKAENKKYCTILPNTVKSGRTECGKLAKKIDKGHHKAITTATSTITTY